MGQPEWPALTVETLIEKMDENGIDRAVLVQTYYTYLYDNTYMIDCALAHRDRFQSVCVIDQLAPGAPDLLSKLVEEHGVRSGVRMLHGQGTNVLGDKRTFPLWERASALGIPICVSARMPELPDARIPIERFTKVKVALEHPWGLDVGDPPYDKLKPLWDMARYPHVYLKPHPIIPTPHVKEEAPLGSSSAS